MITINSPSMCLNDARAAVNYTMDVTQTVSSSDTQRNIVDRVVAAAGRARGGRIDNLILTAHGFPAFFQLGSGLSSGSMAPWADVKGKVFKIWFRGCLVARIAGPHTDRHGGAARSRRNQRRRSCFHPRLCPPDRLLCGCGDRNASQ